MVVAEKIEQIESQTKEGLEFARFFAFIGFEVNPFCCPAARRSRVFIRKEFPQWRYISLEPAVCLYWQTVPEAVMTEEEASRLLRELFESWAPSLLRYALRVGGQIELAEDLVQEAFMVLYRELRSGRKVENPRAWTMAVVRNQMSKAYREQQHWQTTDKPDKLFVWAPATDALPDWSEAVRLFAVLTPREEEVVLLRAQPLKYQEIAKQLGISQSSVGVLLTRALRKLRRAAQAGLSRPGSTMGLERNVCKSPQ